MGDICEDLLDNTERILSLSWDKGVLACSYFRLDNMELYVTFEAPDPEPEFLFLANLFRQIQPAYTLATGTTVFLQEVMRHCVISETEEPRKFMFGNKKTAPLSKFQVFPATEKHLQANRKRILALNLPGMSPNFTQSERFYFLESVLPLKQNLVVHCLGNLLKYLDASWSQIFLARNGETVITDLKVFYLQSQVLVDDCTLSALQIFSNEYHPSGFKMGSTVKEGFSVFSVLNRCCSKMGTKALKALLHQPIRDIRELTRSFDTIQWYIAQKDDPKIKNIEKGLKKIADVGQLFKNMTLRPGNIKNWLRYKEAVHGAYVILINCAELTQTMQNRTLVTDLATTLSDNNIFKNILLTMDTVIDFEESAVQKQFVVKPAIDAELDEKKEEMMKIQDSLQQAVQKEVKNLPSYVTDVVGYYIPEIGYVVKVGSLEENIPIDEFETQNLSYLTKSEDSYFFKNSLCDELNKKYGNLYPEICEHESRICQRLLKLLKENLPAIQKVISLCAKLDYVISFAKVAIEKSLVRPVIVEEKTLRIVNGRHLLWEMKGNFIPNDTKISVSDKNLITVLTAPNASGKSVYMKQVGLIAYLAHVGCYVPADSAVICLLDSIYARAHTAESNYSGVSSFLADLQQMSRVMSNSTEKSLIFIDEFGKSTDISEGQALLAACIEQLSLRGDKCPIAFITTHYTEIVDLLEVTENISLQTFENKNNVEGALVSSFKIKAGHQDHPSYANRIEGVKQFLDEVFKKKTDSEGDTEEASTDGLHRMRVKFAFDQLQSYLQTGSIDAEEIKQVLESLEI